MGRFAGSGNDSHPHRVHGSIQRGLRSRRHFYDLNHTRIFMGLAMIEDVDINTTHLEDTKKTPPSDIKREGDNAEVDVAGSSRNVVIGKKKPKAA